MSEIRLDPIEWPFTVTMTTPGSKSLTNRALVLAALADGTSRLTNVLFADDTLVMIECLGRLGFDVRVDRAESAVLVHGKPGTVLASSAELFCGNSGTTIRFLTALCALGRGQFNLDGIPRMRQRPIGQLVELLRNLGTRVDYLIEEGFPPVLIHADGLAGGYIRFGSAQSSQFLSAVLQVAPYARHEVRVDLESPQTSWPYVSMTMRLMDEFGVTPELIRDTITGEPRQIIIPRDAYRGTDYPIEPDASNACYFLAAAALHPESKVTIRGLGKYSLQGDLAFVDVLRRMGANVSVDVDSVTVEGTGTVDGIDVDMSSMPDQAQTLAVVALFAEGQTTITGLHTLRLKETDRVAALAAELKKLGADVEINGDDLTIGPPDSIHPAAIDTYDDHRMAMSFALAATKSPGVSIRDPECVNKTYPAFFEDLQRVTGKRS